MAAPPHSQGSPIQIKMIAAEPQLAMTELTTDVLKEAVAGKPSRIRLKFFDTYNNFATPEETFVMGIANCNEKKRLTEVRDL